MSAKRRRPLNTLVVDVGGTHIKFAATAHEDLCKYPSGPRMTASEMVDRLLKLTRDWRYDVVSIGYPGVVRNGAPAREPHNLGSGWVGFDFAAAFGRPVRIVNDAAMQALGDYRSGTMLFLGLGTGLGSALVVDGIAVPMELGHLPRRKGRNYEDYLGNKGRKRLGNKKWRAEVLQVACVFATRCCPTKSCWAAATRAGSSNCRRTLAWAKTSPPFAAACAYGKRRVVKRMLSRPRQDHSAHRCANPSAGKNVESFERTSQLVGVRYV